MSLAAFQDAWVRLMLEPDLRRRWQQGELELAGLSPAEVRALRAIDAERLELIAGTVQQGRVSIFVAALPESLRRLVPPDRLMPLAEAYARQDPLATLYPFSRTLPPWLRFLAASLHAAGIPHLEDVAEYEALQIGLHFHHLPQSRHRKGPSRLTPAAALMAAGPALPQVLACLEAGHETADLPQTPRQGYLLQRRVDETRLEPVHWAVYELLDGADGHRGWAAGVARLCRAHPELSAQRNALLAWESHYIEQGVLSPFRA